MSHQNDTHEIDEATAEPPTGLGGKRLAVHQRVFTRVIAEMEKMQVSTEKAALGIGKSLGQIVEIATESNRELADSLNGFVEDDTAESIISSSNDSASIVEMIDRQSKMISELVDMIKDCFAKQLRMTRSASSVCSEIYESAMETEQLMARSRMIALNMHIEAKRLGGQEGASFLVLANEMSRFSSDVAVSNKVIAESIKIFAADMPKLESETDSLNNRLIDFSSNFDREMENVQTETANLSKMLKDIRDDAETRNDEILKCSNSILSDLQFQDPVAQGLLRAAHDLKLVSQLVKGDAIDESSLADIADSVGHNASQEFEEGEIMMF